MLITFNVVFAPMDQRRKFNADTVNANIQAETSIFLTFIIAGAAFFSVGGLMFFHVYLIFTNQSTIELYSNKSAAEKAVKRGDTKPWRNEYDLGWRENFYEAIGRPVYWFACWWMPTPMVELTGDGIKWRTIHDKEDGIEKDKDGHHFQDKLSMVV